MEASISFPLDLSPARWIWFPSQRTLPNTFILFRREFTLPQPPIRASGFICADSRYRLVVNGRRVQWGPAPSDPRQLEADPLDLAPFLEAGINCIAVEVLFYGYGEGTWPGGKPGLIFNLKIDLPGGQIISLVSDRSWQACLDRAHRPGQYKRWYLRALQEEYDARLAQLGWEEVGFAPDSRWLPALELDCPASKPPICSHYPDYLNDAYMGLPANVPALAGVEVGLRTRQVPLLREVTIPALRLAESGRVRWLHDPLDWFDCRTPGSFELVRKPVATQREATAWELPATPDGTGEYATFEFSEQVVGWPYFTIEAPAGTVVELICQESHDPSCSGWLDTHFFSWSRFTCREGTNLFETFDYESLRWLQLHIHEAARPVLVRAVGVRRRLYAWPNAAYLITSEPGMQRLLDASLNTLLNSAQETCMDGPGRERQQTSGDAAHQLELVRYAFGETRLPARYLRTYSSGQAPEGYFMDVWPAVDTLSRISQKQVGATFWGPILDHGVQLLFAGWHHFLETGDLEALREPYPRFLRFAEYLDRLRGADGLLPVEPPGLPTIPYVWMDSLAYTQQRHKQCAFNLYCAAMFTHALAPLQAAFGDEHAAARSRKTGREILAAAVTRYWSAESGLFIDNLPWLAEERTPRMSDRALANAVLFEQCPGGRQDAIRRVLVECPPELGMSFPANAGWRLHALARLGQSKAILRDLRERWATLDSVILNNTIQEGWRARPDTTDQWSHCAVVPAYVMFMDIAGIRPLEPGFTRVQIRPQLGDLATLELTAHTVRGPLWFSARQVRDGHQVNLRLPDGCSGELLLPAGNNAPFARLSSINEMDFDRFLVDGGREVDVFINGAGGS